MLEHILPDAAANHFHHCTCKCARCVLKMQHLFVIKSNHSEGLNYTCATQLKYDDTTSTRTALTRAPQLQAPRTQAEHHNR